MRYSKGIIYYNGSTLQVQLCKLFIIAQLCSTVWNIDILKEDTRKKGK
jgi:hypothetical protein